MNSDLTKLCDNILEFGDLLIIGNKGIGKTNTLMVLSEQFMDMENTRVIIFETFPKWINQFDTIPYFVIEDKDVKETNHEIDIGDYFLKHSSDYALMKGTEIKQFLKHNRHGLFLIEVMDITRIAFAMYSIVNHFYRKQYLRLKKGYSTINEKIIFVLEESQNICDSSVLSKKLFNRFRKMFSEARNLNLHFILASQRLQDLNTKIRGRTRLLIGNVNVDDYELKIRRILKHSPYQKDVLKLPKGMFIYPALNKLITFPRFKQSSKPFQYKPKKVKETMKKSKWTRFKEGIRELKAIMRHERELGNIATRDNRFVCESCGKAISKEEYEFNNGLCNQCYQDREMSEYDGTLSGMDSPLFPPDI